MFFRRKGWLRAEFDEKLIHQLNELKGKWDRQSNLYKKSFDPFGEMEIQTDIEKAKYLFLLREAKHRHISALNSTSD